MSVAVCFYWITIDWFLKYGHRFRVILCREFKELGSLYVLTDIFRLVALGFFLYAPVEYKKFLTFKKCFLFASLTKPSIWFTNHSLMNTR